MKRSWAAILGVVALSVVLMRDAQAAHSLGVLLVTAGDVSNATASFANITGLSWDAAPNTTYVYNCQLVYTSTATTTGIAISNNGPASPTLNDQYAAYQTLGNALAPSATALLYSHQVAYQTGTATTAVAAAATNYVAMFHGVFRNGSTAGAVNIQWKSSGAVSTTIKQYSWCLLHL